MAEKIFVIYASLAGTASARPVLEFYNEDEAHVPALAALGYTPAETGWIAVDPFTVTDTADEATGRALTVNQTTGAIAEAAFARGDVATAQLALSVQIAELIAEWNWTQELDARITKTTQQAFADWIVALEAIPANPLWVTNPAGIAIPAAPAVAASTLTVGRQVAAADWTDDSAMPSQKMAIANWATLQPVWGLDRGDLTPFIADASSVLSFVSGRSGARALRLTSNGASPSPWVRTQPNHAFAMGPGDIFHIEAMMKSTASAVVSIGLRGFDMQPPSVDLAGGGHSITVMLGTAWTRVSGYVQVPTTNPPARWGTAEVRQVVPGGVGPSIIDIDGLTVSRSPRVQNAFAQSSATVEITHTGSVGTGAQQVLALVLPGGDVGSVVRLDTSAHLIQPGNNASDQTRVQFWLTAATPLGSETILASWVEQGSGAWQQRASNFSWADAATGGEQTTYRLRASKLGSVGAMSLGHRSLHAIQLPKI